MGRFQEKTQILLKLVWTNARSLDKFEKEKEKMSKNELYFEIIRIFAPSFHGLTIRVESREEQDFIDTASEQDITDTTPFLNSPLQSKGYVDP